MAGRTISTDKGDTSKPLIEDTIGIRFDKTVAKFGERPAIIVPHQNVEISYDEMKEQVDAMAAGLVALGLAPGERIGIWAPNCVEWTITQFATAKAGLILVNINPAYRISELEYALNKVGCTALVTAAQFKTSDYIAMIRELAPEIDACAPGELKSAKLPDLRLVIRLGGEKTPGMLNYADIPAMAEDSHRQSVESLAGQLKVKDAINIQFTSGTTGFPKGATLTHHGILNNAEITGDMMLITKDDRVCIPVPLYHCFGMVIGNLTCVIHGAAMVYPGEAFDPLSVLKVAESEKCTALYGVPTMFIAELEHPDFKKFDLSNLRTGIMAGAPCPVEVMKRVIDEMNMKYVTIAYGMTEVSPVATQSRHDDSLERRVTTVGQVQPHVEIKIADPSGAPVAIGETGEFMVKGYGVMLGYWDDEKMTSEAIEDGWMHTGDLATMDADGYCNIVGRIKEMVIRGGENVYPREIEEFLFRNPKIADVQIFGIPDPKYGEEVAAWVKLKEGESATEDDIKAYCKGQIAHYKVPRHIKFVDSFPMTVTGKIQKFVMRDQMAEELGLAEQKTA